MSDDLQTLRGVLLHQRWQDECEVIPAYRAPYQKPEESSRCVVRHIPSGRFLRHSAGPRTGTFWDMYGDDFLTEALATVELSKAPAPIMGISVERRRAILELPTHVLNGKRYVFRDDLLLAVDGVIFTPLPANTDHGAEAEAAGAGAGINELSTTELLSRAYRFSGKPDWEGVALAKVLASRLGEAMADQRVLEAAIMHQATSAYVAIDQVEAVLVALGKFDLPDRIEGGAGRSISYGALCRMRDRLEGALRYLPGERVKSVSDGNTADVQANDPGGSRTRDLRIKRSSVQEHGLAAQSETSNTLDAEKGRTETDLEGSTSPSVSKSCQTPIKIGGWGANSQLREIHIDDGIAVRLNDTQLEARSPGGTWQPLTLSIIPRSLRMALADLLTRPFQNEHASNCRIRSGGLCTCPAGART